MGTQPHPGETRVRGLVHRELVKPWHQRCEQMKPRKIKMKDDLAALRSRLGDAGASRRAAEIVIKHLGGIR